MREVYTGKFGSVILTRLLKSPVKYLHMTVSVKDYSLFSVFREPTEILWTDIFPVKKRRQDTILSIHRWHHNMLPIKIPSKQIRRHLLSRQ